MAVFQSLALSPSWLVRRAAPRLAWIPCLLLLAGLPASPVWAQSLSSDAILAALTAARAQGCEGRAGLSAPWQRRSALDAAARRAAQGAPAMDAARQSGYRPRAIYQVRFSGYRDARAVAQAMRSRHCQALSDPSLADVGAHQQGDTYWVLIAAPFNPPAAADAPAVAAEVLRRVNEARAQPRRCGDRAFEAAAPLQYDATLERAAAAHAQDMARQGYLEHRARDGSTPGERATRAGYRWQTVGENLASGVFSAQEAVEGWLRSPGHCANLMQAAFTEMGVAFAVNADSEAGIYWAQTLARPRR